MPASSSPPPAVATVVYKLPSSSPSSTLYKDAINLSSRGDHLAARRLLSRVVEDDPLFVGGHALLGNSYTALADLNGAEEE